MRLLFRALFKEFALCILSLWVYRRVCAPGCSFVRCCARWRVTGGCGGRRRAGLCLGASLGEAGALSILLPHAQGVSGAATAGMMLIVGALPALGAGLRALRCCLAKAGGDRRALLWLCAPSAAPVPGWGHRHQNSSCRKAGGSRASPGLQSEPAQGEILEPNLSKACSGLGSLLGPAVCAPGTSAASAELGASLGAQPEMGAAWPLLLLSRDLFLCLFCILLLQLLSPVLTFL